MDISIEDSMAMEAYFNDELNKAEVLEFLDKVASNKELQEAFEFEKFLRGKTNMPAVAEMPKISKPIQFNFTRYLIAASIIVLVVFTAIMFYNNNRVKKDKVITNTISPVTIDSNLHKLPADTNNTIALRDKLANIYNAAYERYKPSGNEPAELGNVMLAYQHHDYAKALNEISNVGIIRGSNSQDSLINDYNNLYKAFCFAETQQPVKALNTFQQLIAGTNNNEIKLIAQWHFALELLKQKDVQKATSVLKTIVQENNKFSVKAKTVLQQLEVPGKK